MINIDQIRAAFMKQQEIDPTRRYHVILNGHMSYGRVTVGEIFGMPLVADPECPEDTFYIEAIPEGNENNEEE